MPSASPTGALLEVTDLQKYFPVRKGILWEKTVGYVKAVDGVSFAIPEGKTLGLVGESGSGKSTTGYCILQLMRPTGGSIRFQDRELTELKGEELRRMRQDMQIVFQDPYSSLDPRMTVGEIVSEPLEVHGIGTRKGRAETRSQAARGGRVQPELHEPLPARVLGRPAPAHRHRPRARAQPEADHLRRAGLGARRLDPGADPQPAQGPPAGLRAHLPLHLPRPRRRADDGRRDRRHEPGQARRGRPRGAGLHEPEGRVHEGALRRRARPGSAPPARAEGRAGAAQARAHRPGCTVFGLRCRPNLRLSLSSEQVWLARTR